ncbi:MAG: hypothetical protein WAU81_15220 [Candidatus Aminicenantales bacterium]
MKASAGEWFQETGGGEWKRQGVGDGGESGGLLDEFFDHYLLGAPKPAEEKK